MLNNPNLDGRTARMLFRAWSVACVLVLLFAFLRRDLESTDVIFSYLMLALTFPLGFLFNAGFGAGLLLLHEAMNFSLPLGFFLNLLTWVLFVAAGYLQWFVMLPNAWRKFHAD